MFKQKLENGKCETFGCRGALYYWREGTENDFYYCEKCLDIHIWNGRGVFKAGGKVPAHLIREKPVEKVGG